MDAHDNPVECITISLLTKLLLYRPQAHKLGLQGSTNLLNDFMPMKFKYRSPFSSIAFLLRASESVDASGCQECTHGRTGTGIRLHSPLQMAEKKKNKTKP